MYGIIGNPLEQTFSPGYFNHKFEQLGLKETYRKFPLGDISDLTELLRQQPQLKGLNVTIPFKEKIIPFLDELDETAARAGAVNTIRIRDGRLKGFNTDVTGFRNTLLPLLQPQHRAALVLGTGGAAKAVAFVLQQLSIPFRFVSRSPAPEQLSYRELNKTIMQEHRLIINTTPLGMTPAIDAAPELPYEYLDTSHLLYDLIYNPAETLFLQKGAEQGATIKNGYDMLIGQAEAAWAIWNSSTA